MLTAPSAAVWSVPATATAQRSTVALRTVMVLGVLAAGFRHTLADLFSLAVSASALAPLGAVLVLSVVVAALRGRHVVVNDVRVSHVGAVVAALAIGVGVLATRVAASATALESAVLGLDVLALIVVSAGLLALAFGWRAVASLWPAFAVAVFAWPTPYLTLIGTHVRSADAVAGWSVFGATLVLLSVALGQTLWVTRRPATDARVLGATTATRMVLGACIATAIALTTVGAASAGSLVTASTVQRDDNASAQLVVPGGWSVIGPSAVAVGDSCFAQASSHDRYGYRSLAGGIGDPTVGVDVVRATSVAALDVEGLANCYASSTAQIVNQSAIDPAVLSNAAVVTLFDDVSMTTTAVVTFDVASVENATLVRSIVSISDARMDRDVAVATLEAQAVTFAQLIAQR